MKRIVKDFHHRTGYHCGSTSMSNILNYYGLSLSEPLCFGLGSGISFAYFCLPLLSPPVFIGGRTEGLEVDLGKNLGFEISVEKDDDFDASFKILKQEVNNNHPLIVWVDAYYLPYFKTPYHFSVHRVILVGYNDKEKLVYIADNEREEIREVSFDLFKEARTSSGFPLPTENRYFKIRVGKDIKPYRLAIKDALSKTADTMLRSEKEYEGIKGMRNMAKDLPEWKDILGDKWLDAAKTVYLLSEKFGSGGGNFRHLYAKFLEEAKELMEGKSLDKIALEFKEIANKWQEVARLFKEASKKDDFSRIIEASKIINYLSEKEERIYQYLT